MSGAEAERCERCDRVLATDADMNSMCPDGCECVMCSVLCWRNHNAQCNHPAVDWRSRCLDAEVVVAAAEAWVKGDWATARHKRADLAAAIDAYRARGK